MERRKRVAACFAGLAVLWNLLCLFGALPGGRWYISLAIWGIGSLIVFDLPKEERVKPPALAASLIWLVTCVLCCAFG